METQELLCTKNGKLHKEGKGKGVVAAAIFFFPVLFNPLLLQKRAAPDAGAGRDIFINGWCWTLWSGEGTAPTSSFADRLCTLGKTVGKGRTAPNLGDDSCGKSGCFSSVI